MANNEKIIGSDIKDFFLLSHVKEGVIGTLFLVTYFPTFCWMWERWFSRDSYYSHGILVPAVVIFLIWQNRAELAKCKKEESPWGLRLIILGIGIHLISSVLRVYSTSGFSMLLVLIGLILHFYGSKIFDKIMFPIAFLFFMIPLPLFIISNISFKMKIFAAEIATIMLNNMRLPAIREGSIIRMRTTYVIVDDVCSGLRSLISLTALGSIFAYWMKGPMFKRVLLFAMTIPIAIVTNVFRVILLSAVSEIWGSQYATGFLHDLSGFLVFGLAFVLLYATGKIIE